VWALVKVATRHLVARRLVSFCERLLRLVCVLPALASVACMCPRPVCIICMHACMLRFGLYFGTAMLVVPFDVCDQVAGRDARANRPHRCFIMREGDGRYTLGVDAVDVNLATARQLPNWAESCLFHQIRQV
jgi:hypothetical protein